MLWGPWSILFISFQIAIIFDESGFSIGKRVIMDMSNYNEVLKVHRQGVVKNLLFG